MGLLVFVGVIFMLLGAVVINLPILFPDLIVNSGTSYIYYIGISLVLLGVLVVVLALKDRGTRSSGSVSKKEEIVIGVVKQFKDGKGKLVNGLPPITLEVEYFYDDMFQTVDIDTDEYDESVYPIGSELRLAVHGKRVRLLDE